MSEPETEFVQLPSEYVEKWRAFADKVSEGAREVFGEEKPGAIMIGVQFGEMGIDPELPSILVSSNLPVCDAPTAARMILEVAEVEHLQFHNGEIPPEMVVEEIEEEKHVH